MVVTGVPLVAAGLVVATMKLSFAKNRPHAAYFLLLIAALTQKVANSLRLLAVNDGSVLSLVFAKDYSHRGSNHDSEVLIAVVEHNEYTLDASFIELFQTVRQRPPARALSTGICSARPP